MELRNRRAVLLVLASHLVGLLEEEDPFCMGHFTSLFRLFSSESKIGFYLSYRCLFLPVNARLGTLGGKLTGLDALLFSPIQDDP